MKISSVSEMRSADQRAAREFGIEEPLLMENAGFAAYRILENCLNGSVKGKRVAFFCGMGNNGGDGFVVARKLLSNGGIPIVFILGDPQKYKNAAQLNYNIITKLPISVKRIQSGEDYFKEAAHANALVDGILGTGLQREVSGFYKETVENINALHETGKTVLALDIPSGVNGDNGEIMGCAVCADHTVTFGLPKIGNLLYPGAKFNGKLHVTHISFPPEISADDNIKTEINIPPSLPGRIPHGHKGSFGKALIVSGAKNYYGAPYLSSIAFLKAGGGYVRLAAPESMVPHLAQKGTEIVFHPQKETKGKALGKDDLDDILSIARISEFTVMGPGVSLDPETVQLMQALTAEIKGPLLIDGDGITAVSHNISLLKNRTDETILTPHLGEAARLLTALYPEDEHKGAIETILKDPVCFVRETSKALSAHIVLKGARTLIGRPDGKVLVNMTGNSGMATAGSGDVLTGAIGAMKGLGMDTASAVRAGVFVHGFAGDLAARKLGPDGVTASDILAYLPLAVKKYRRGDFDPLGGVHIV